MGGSQRMGSPQGMGGSPSAWTGGTGSAGSGMPSSGMSGYGSSGPSIGSSTGAGLKVSGDTIDAGRYSIAASKNDDGSLTVTDKQTGKSFEVFGDPHIKVDGKDTADFQKDNLNIQLQDGTVIHMQPDEAKNGVSHLDQVSVTRATNPSRSAARTATSTTAS